MNTSRQDPAKRRGSRYRARRRAVDILFEAEFRDVDPVAIVQDRIELSQQPDPPVAPIAEYTQHIVGGVAVELDRVDDTISRYLADNWLLERIPAVDRAILRIAVWEMLFNPDVPVKTAVVEGVELGSEYSTDFAAPYINAVLDAVARNIEELRAEALAEIETLAEGEALDVSEAFGEAEAEGEVLDVGEAGELESMDAELSGDEASEEFPVGEPYGDGSSEQPNEAALEEEAQNQPITVDAPETQESLPVESSVENTEDGK
ncbi:hypothetical protein CCANI_07795 [Corynebacterium canis]|nr:transcription antitermination factor NusB [Corynebacterium canis]WJY75394.1 hypothetical protein CCANI_07795 [Corynebacterium canis]